MIILVAFPTRENTASYIRKSHIKMIGNFVTSTDFV
jgi:hypothetical protein